MEMPVDKWKHIAYLRMVNLHCDKCGKIMKNSGLVFMSDPIKYRYKCECGFTVDTEDQYPCIREEMEDGGFVGKYIP